MLVYIHIYTYVNVYIYICTTRTKYLSNPALVSFPPPSALKGSPDRRVSAARKLWKAHPPKQPAVSGAGASRILERLKARERERETMTYIMHYCAHINYIEWTVSVYILWLWLMCTYTCWGSRILIQAPVTNPWNGRQPQTVQTCLTTGAVGN